jgi:hypothetical protein
MKKAAHFSLLSLPIKVFYEKSLIGNKWVGKMDFFKKSRLSIIILSSCLIGLSVHAGTKRPLSKKAVSKNRSVFSNKAQRKTNDYFSSLHDYMKEIKVIPNLAFGALNINKSNDLRLSNTPAPGVVNRYEPSGNNFADFLIGLNFSVRKRGSDWYWKLLLRLLPRYCTE